MKTILKTILLIASLLAVKDIESQSLLESSRQEIELSNQQKVVLFSTKDCQSCYYFLPLNFRYSFNTDSIPEVSFVSWKNDDNTKTIGGILHFLTLWGLSVEQEEELQSTLINEIDSNGVILGTALVEGNAPDSKIQLQGDDKLTTILENSLTSRSLVATTPGAKMALSFKFEEPSIKPILELLTKPKKIKTELLVELKYQVLSQHTGMPTYQRIKMKLPLASLFSLIQQNQ